MYVRYVCNIIYNFYKDLHKNKIKYIYVGYMRNVPLHSDDYMYSNVLYK